MKPPLQVELLTTDGCPIDGCTCADTNLIVKQAAVDGVSMALHKPFPGDALVFEHRTMTEFSTIVRGHEAPVLLINDRIALEGHAWGNKEVRMAVETYVASPSFRMTAI